MKTILGAKVDPNAGLPSGSPTGRDAERILAGELLSAFRDHQRTQTEFMERIAGRITNHVLAVRTVTFDANASPITMTFGSPIGAVRIRTAGHAVTVQSGSAGATAPTGGTGVWITPANTAETVPIGATTVTFWGTAADILCVQAYTSGPLVVS